MKLLELKRLGKFCSRFRATYEVRWYVYARSMSLDQHDLITFYGFPRTRSSGLWWIEMEDLLRPRSCRLSLRLSRSSNIYRSLRRLSTPFVIRENLETRPSVGIPCAKRWKRSPWVVLPPWIRCQTNRLKCNTSSSLQCQSQCCATCYFGCFNALLGKTFQQKLMENSLIDISKISTIVQRVSENSERSTKLQSVDIFS